jgi:hypothetical protein
MQELPAVDAVLEQLFSASVPRRSSGTASSHAHLQVRR